MKSSLGNQWNATPQVLLCDNGTLRADAVLGLRDLAKTLGLKVNSEVRAVGLLHTDRLDGAVLGGKPGAVLLKELRQSLADGSRSFIVLPFFLGPSRGITEWLPAQLEELTAKWPDLRLLVAPCLHADGDDRLARGLSDKVLEVVSGSGIERPFVALVDHGTPVPEVNSVRERVGEQVRELLGDEVAGLATCSMERRPEPEYNFNEPLLENLLRDQGTCPSDHVVVAQFFLSPGRHAGPDGDVAKICRDAELARTGLQTFVTTPLGDHPLVLEILEDRLRDCLDAD
jgi:sirohydrochlorin ferrochelatase